MSGVEPDRQEAVYAGGAEAYDRLVAAEDVDGALPELLRGLVAPGAVAVEAGAGTGRCSRLLAALGARVVATERARPMLDVAAGHLRREAGTSGWVAAVADARALPVRAASADVGLAGWVFGHLRLWLPATWRGDVGAAVGELRRAVRPGGAVVVIESLSTAAEAPAPPTPELGELHAWFDAQGFERHVLRTDYGFASADDAAAVLGPFFGDDLASRVRASGRGRVPEWTAAWVERRAAGPSGVSFAPEPFAGVEARALLDAYLAETSTRLGLPLGDSLTADPLGMVPPGGAFVVGRLDGAPVACGGVQGLAPGVAEIKRMYVAPAARGRGAGRDLLAALEAEARALGAAVVRLDTDERLVQALTLYGSSGYRRIPAYNDNLRATAWFEKALAPTT